MQRLQLWKKVLCMIGGCLLASLIVWAAAEPQRVQVQKGQMRAQPSFLARVIKTLTYGDLVQVLQQDLPWVRVSDRDGLQGWVYTSALTQRQFLKSPGKDDGTSDTGATSEEISLAGKGFNKQVEVAFKSRHPTVDFTWVDRMEKITVSRSEMRQFLRRGRVKPAKGGV